MDTFATLYVKALPVYADIDPETFNIDPEDVRKKITDKTKAIIVVHLYGLPADIDPIMELAEEKGIVVIEDSAQCVLGRYKGRIAGSIGHMACFSFENSKHISVGEGGMVLTNDEYYTEKVRKYAGIGFKNLTAESGRVRANDDIFQSPDYLRHDTLGYNYRLPELNSAVALAQLERLPRIVGLRQRIAKRYLEAVEGCESLVPQKVPEGYTNSYWTFALRYKGMSGRSWQEFRKAYIKNGGDGYYGAWQVPYNEPVMQNHPKRGSCPVAEKLQKSLMQLKTNYQDVHVATQKAEALRNTIKELSQSPPIRNRRHVP
jgi:perosamine synthetase